MVNKIKAKQLESRDFARFTDFMKRLVAVPHSEIKAAMEAEKREKASSASRVPVASKKH